MEKELNITSPKYQQIATDFASKIAKREYKVGEKVYARSSLASRYGVSPETARRAICILSDLQIVETTKGSGVIIKSYENAIKFIQQYNDIQTVNNLKEEILKSLSKQSEQLKYTENRITDLIDRTEKFRSINPFVPFELEITAFTPHLNKTASEINFWHNTSATIIAIKRGSSLLMSPGPYSVFLENDRLYFIGDENCSERVRTFMYPAR